MRWLVGNKKKKRQPTGSSRQTTPRRPWDPYRTLLGLKVLGAVVLCTAAVFSWPRVERFLTVRVIRRVSGPVGVEGVVLVEAPAWMSMMVRRDLGRQVAACVGDDPLDVRGLERAVSALNRSPWVAQVRWVRRTGGGQVAVLAGYREPVAVVRGREGYHLVDAGAVRLPGLYLKHQLDRLGLPLITGVGTAPAAEGRAWPGRGLQAGLSLVRFLDGEPYLDQIRSIDVGYRDERGRIRLLLRTSHGLVRWGFPPGDERAIEPAAATKKQWLSAVYRQRGSIDAGGKVVEVFGPAVFVRQPGYREPGTPRGGMWLGR